ncbi:MAG: fluoride efflux transporter FluC [Acidimicrobiales bacterium]
MPAVRVPEDLVGRGGRLGRLGLGLGWRRAACVGCGAALGATIRVVLLAAGGPGRVLLVILVLNLAGSMVAGFLLAVGRDRSPKVDFGVVGLCGGLTTFSAVAVEAAVGLAGAPGPMAAAGAAYAAGSVAVAIAGFLVGGLIIRVGSGGRILAMAIAGTLVLGVSLVETEASWSNLWSAVVDEGRLSGGWLVAAAIAFVVLAAAGGLIRAAMAAWLNRGPMPWGTLAVNVVGSGLAGLAWGSVNGWVIIVSVGGLGALTTMSGAAREVTGLVSNRRLALAGGYLAASLALGLAAAAAGIAMTGTTR